MMFTMGTGVTHTNNVLHRLHYNFPPISDFGYMNANQNFKSMDRLMKHANERTDETGVHFLYSTPSCFLKALNDEGETWPTKTDDFFPYASGNVQSVYMLHLKVTRAYDVSHHNHMHPLLLKASSHTGQDISPLDPHSNYTSGFPIPCCNLPSKLMLSQEAPGMRSW